MQGKQDLNTPNKEKIDGGTTISEVFPTMDAGFSYRGSRATNPSAENAEQSISPGYKRMTLFNHELQSFCLATVPENTPELTQEEYERYSRINPK